MLLLGPGHGNNLNVLLDLLCSANIFDVSLLTEKYHDQNLTFRSIRVFEFHHRFKLMRRIKELIVLARVPKQDIFCILGGSNLYELVPALLMIKRTKTIFNVWSEGVPKVIKQKNIQAILYRLVFASCDVIWCNWYGTADLILQSCPSFEHKLKVQAWGLSQEFMMTKSIEHSFTVDFIKQIPKDKVTFINMRSLSAYNEIALILDSTMIMRNRYPEQYSKLLIIFWQGNNVDKKLMQDIEDHISFNDMRDVIWCVEHPFLSSSDIRHVMENIDVVINYVNNDQLSLSVLESIYLKKIMIASDIQAYRLLNERLNTNIPLTSLDAISLACAIRDSVEQVLSNEVDTGILNTRKQVVEHFFCRDTVIKGITDIIRIAN